jgi:hypothetical protein
MHIDDNKWNEIVKAVQAGIDRWNASAAKHKTKDVFRLTHSKTTTYSVIIAEHVGGPRKALLRNAAGEVRSTKIKTNKKEQITGYTTRVKNWKTLADKPAGEIVDKTNLLNFFVPISARVTSTSRTQWYRGFCIEIVEANDVFTARVGGEQPEELTPFNSADEAEQAALAAVEKIIKNQSKQNARRPA